MLTGTLTDEQLKGMARSPTRTVDAAVVEAASRSLPASTSRLVRLGVALRVLERLLPLVKDEPRMVGAIGEAAARAYVAVLPNLSTPTDSEEEKGTPRGGRRPRRGACAKRRSGNGGTREFYWALARSAFAAGADEAEVPLSRSRHRACLGIVQR